MPDLTETSPPSSPATPSPVAASSPPPAPPPPERPAGSGPASKTAASKPGPSSPQATPPRPPEPPRPMPPPPPPPPPPPSKAPLVLGIIGFVLLAAVAVWQWTELSDLREQLAAQSDGAAQAAKMEALAADVRATQQQVQALAQKSDAPPAPPPAPAAPPVDLTPIETQLKALQDRPTPAPVDLGPLEAQVKALEERQPPPPVDLAPLEAQIKALADRPPPPPPPVVDLTPLEKRLATIEGKPPPDDSELRGRIAELTKQLDAMSAKFATAQTQLTAAQAQSGERLARSDKLEAAALALTSGKAVGEVPDAPAALQKFATAAPPTEASLRLSFETAAKAAETASDPAAGSTDIGDRIWQRVQTLVTVRQGDHVLVGPPANVVIAESRKHLVAGDLAGAVAALDRLDPAAAKAMSGWRADAQSLLDARAALATLVASGSATP